MNKRLKSEVSNHLRATQRAFIPGTSTSRTPPRAYQKISRKLQTGPEQRAVLFDGALLGGGSKPGELETAGLCRVSGAEQQPP